MYSTNILVARLRPFTALLSPIHSPYFRPFFKTFSTPCGAYNPKLLILALSDQSNMKLSQASQVPIYQSPRLRETAMINFSFQSTFEDWFSAGLVMQVTSPTCNGHKSVWENCI